MAIIKLDSQRCALVDDDDLPALYPHQWFYLNGYAVRRQRTASGAVLILMHRELLRASPGELVDHIDGDRLNNRRSNLRICTPSQNQANRRTAGYRGVYYEGRSGRWRAQIKIQQRNRYLGTFDTPEAAARAYDRAAYAAWGRFARLNHPELAGEYLEQLALPLWDRPESGPDWYEMMVRSQWRRSRPPIEAPVEDAGAIIPY